jgi:two-component system, sensor histidine kinase and response regulator
LGNIVYSDLDNSITGWKNLAFILRNYDGTNRTYISDAIYDITGYSSEELIQFPENIRSLIHESDSIEIKRSLIELESDPSRESANFIYRIRTKKNEIIWIEDCIIIMRQNGKIISSKSLIININDLKKKETELQSAFDNLKNLNVQKDKFISIISHDLRAPFTTLLGFSEILLNESDISDEEKSEYLQYIYDSSRSQLNMINCLLDWSRLQTGRIKVEPLRLNVKHVISNAITPLTGDSVRKNIDMKIDIPADLSMNADERLIGQAIIHLTSNAIKFTQEGKDVHISASRFKEGLIEIVVRDEGLGISEENQTKLFRIDEKFSLHGTNGEKGSGLGLTLVKEIVDKHGGQVWFYSQVGEGSEFHFTIPEAKNLILLVEDEESTRALYKKMIESVLGNFEVRFADNGYVAINMYRELLPTIVLTDHEMPLMNGLKFVEEIQKKESNKAVPIIVISAKLDDELTRKYLKLGVDKIIPKPVDQKYLVDAIRECLY